MASQLEVASQCAMEELALVAVAPHPAHLKATQLATQLAVQQAQLAVEEAHLELASQPPLA